MKNLHSELKELSIFNITTEYKYICHILNETNQLLITSFKIFSNNIYQLIIDKYGCERILKVTMLDIINNINNGILLKIN